MANAHKGEVALEHDGKVHVLRLSINEICELETDLDMGINDITDRLNDANKLRVGLVRAIFYRALVGGGASVTKAEAGDLLSEIGVPKAMEKIGEAFSASFPVDEGDTTENPPKAAKAGTGKSS